MGYLTNFIVYTLAMIGVIFIALMVFKSTSGISSKKTSKFLKVHDTLSLGGRKTLYIVSAGEEKFLIAGDIDKTSLISKLETKEKNIETNVITKSFKDVAEQAYSLGTKDVGGGVIGIAFALPLVKFLGTYQIYHIHQLSWYHIPNNIDQH